MNQLPNFRLQLEHALVQQRNLHPSIFVALLDPPQLPVHELQNPNDILLLALFHSIQLTLHGAELTLNLLKAVVDSLEPLVDLLEPLVDLLEPLVDLLEPLVDLLEPLVDSLESRLQLLLNNFA